VTVEIFNLKGMLIRELMRENEVTSVNTAWDGRDRLNRLVPPGPYLYRVRARGRADFKGVIVVLR